MKTTKLTIALIIIVSGILNFPLKAQEKTKDNPPMEKIEIAVEKIERTKVAGHSKSSGPAEKTQFDLILKSKAITDKNGEFSITIPSEQFKLIPENSSFTLKLKIKPPKDFPGAYDNDEATITLKQKDGPRYKLILHWIPIKGKSNKGTFAVSSKAQT